MKRDFRIALALARKQRKKMEEAQKKKIGISPGHMVRKRREILGWKGVELARRSGIDPRTLDAIEKGRIESPSVRNLQALAKALGISVAAIFAEEQSEAERIFIGGNQKGHHTLEFQKDGFRLVCHTPLVPNLFVGKVILKGEAHIEPQKLPTSGIIFVQAILGKFVLHFEGKDHLIHEGNYAFFDGHFPHHFSNPHYKESTFLLITAPSFLTRTKGF